MHASDPAIPDAQTGPTHRIGGSVGHKPEALLAELAAAAYRVTRRGGPKGAFIDVELDLWYAAQARLRLSPGANSAEGAGWGERVGGAA